jgi:hypothetical protein
MTFAATIVTLYPEMFPGPLRQKLLVDVFELSVDTRAKDGVSWGVRTHD